MKPRLNNKTLAIVMNTELLDTIQANAERLSLAPSALCRAILAAHFTDQRNNDQVLGLHRPNPRAVEVIGKWLDQTPERRCAS